MFKLSLNTWFFYFLNSGAAWEEAFLDTMRQLEDGNVFKHIATARFASRTLELELEENTKTIVPYFSSTFILMALFSVVTCMMTDWVRSKPWLGLLGNVSAAMATVAAFGLCIYLGVDFIGLNLAAPFLMIDRLVEHKISRRELLRSRLLSLALNRDIVFFLNLI